MRSITFSEADKIRWEYNMLDCIYTREVAAALREQIKLKGDKFQQFYDYQQYKVAPALVNIMNRGIRIDLEKKHKLQLQLTELLVDVENKLNFLLEEPFNPKSTPQMRNVFKNLLGVKLKKDKKSKTESCASPYMLQYLDEYPEYRALITLILEYRSIGVFLRTFVNAELDDDGRMRSAYNCAGTKTGRLASRKNAFGGGANLQNIPSKGKIKLRYALAELEEDELEEELEEVIIDEDAEGITALPNCKEFFIPDEGYMFWNADYSGADAMVVAWDSDCEWLQNFFLTSKQKLYVYVASHYLQKEITTEDRWYKIFKQFIHLTNYGGVEEKAAMSAGISIKDAKQLRQWYFKLCPEIPQWHRRIASEIKTRGYVENIFGRRMWFLNKDCPTMLNQAIAAIPQSTIADLTNHGLVNIEQAYAAEITTAHVLMQIHDALAGQYKIEDKLADEVIISCMQIELPYKTKLVIPAEISTSAISYGHCK